MSKNISKIENSRSLFIVFEGLDCSGSSTQANLLAKSLRNLGRRVYLTSEPSSGPVGQLIRSYFSGRIPSSFSRHAEDKFFGCLFAADRLDHIFNPVNGVIFHLKNSVDVVSTRYKYSSLAYNAESDSEHDFILKANSELPDPDVLIYLDCPVEVCLARMGERVMRETYEKSERKLEMARRNFTRDIQLFPGNRLIVDATKTIDSLADEIFHFVVAALKETEE